jgi:DNA polymerase elongation subunit (family B)
MICFSVFDCHELTRIPRTSAGFDLFDDELNDNVRPNNTMNASDFIIDIREYDVPYHVRVAIDKGVLSSARNQGVLR